MVNNTVIRRVGGINVSNLKETIDFSLLLKKWGRGQDFTTATHSQSVQFSSQVVVYISSGRVRTGSYVLCRTVRSVASVAVDGLWNMRRKRRHRDLFGIRFFVHVTGECGNGRGRCATPGSNSNPQQTYATYPGMVEIDNNAIVSGQLLIQSRLPITITDVLYWNVLPIACCTIKHTYNSRWYFWYIW